MKNSLKLIAGLLLAPLVYVPAAEAARTPHNVLFIAIDDPNDWAGVFGGAPQDQSATPAHQFQTRIKAEPKIL